MILSRDCVSLCALSAFFGGDSKFLWPVASVELLIILETSGTCGVETSV